jgi:hypothetical protein
MPATARRAHPYPADGDTPDVPSDVQALAENLDDVALHDRGTRAAMDAATPTLGNFFATNNEPVGSADGRDRLYLGNGAAWILVAVQGETDAAARTASNWNLGTQARRTIDASDYDLDDVLDYLLTLVADLQALKRVT